MVFNTTIQSHVGKESSGVLEIYLDSVSRTAINVMPFTTATMVMMRS